MRETTGWIPFSQFQSKRERNAWKALAVGAGLCSSYFAWAALQTATSTATVVGSVVLSVLWYIFAGFLIFSDWKKK